MVGWRGLRQKVELYILFNFLYFSMFVNILSFEVSNMEMGRKPPKQFSHSEFWVNNSFSNTVFQSSQLSLIFHSIVYITHSVSSPPPSPPSPPSTYYYYLRASYLATSSSEGVGSGPSPYSSGSAMTSGGCTGKLLEF